MAELAKKIKAFVVPEINCGQIVLEVERCSYGNADVIFVPHGEKGFDNPDDLLSAIKQTTKEKKVRNRCV